MNRKAAHPFGSSAYRVEKSGTNLSLKRYRFTNKERDHETGLYYFGVRYYAAWLGRWTSSDPGGFVDGLNLYCYVRNNPVNGVDAMGYNTESTHTDKNGKVIAVFNDGDKGVYRHDDLDLSGGQHIDGILSNLEQSREAFGTDGGGQYMGTTPIWDSFWDHRTKKAWGEIDFFSSEAGDEIMKFENQIAELYKRGDEAEVILAYMNNAGTWDFFDFKSKGASKDWSTEDLTNHRYRGSQIKPQLYASARDIGNFEAGMITGAFGVPAPWTAKVRGAFNAVDNNLSDVWGITWELFTNWTEPYGEEPNSYKMQVIGEIYGETRREVIYKKGFPKMNTSKIKW